MLHQHGIGCHWSYRVGFIQYERRSFQRNVVNQVFVFVYEEVYLCLPYFCLSYIVDLRVINTDFTGLQILLSFVRIIYIKMLLFHFDNNANWLHIDCTYFLTTSYILLQIIFVVFIMHIAIFSTREVSLICSLCFVFL